MQIRRYDMKFLAQYVIPILFLCLYIGCGNNNPVAGTDTPGVTIQMTYSVNGTKDTGFFMVQPNVNMTVTSAKYQGPTPTDSFTLTGTRAFTTQNVVFQYFSPPTQDLGQWYWSFTGTLSSGQAFFYKANVPVAGP